MRQRLSRLIILLLGVLLAAQSALSAAVSVPAQEPFMAWLPLIKAGNPTPNRLGFDLRTYAGDGTVPLMSAAQPQWARAGDIDWSEIEPVRGGGYHWEKLAAVEANIKRIRAAGIEPTLVIQRVPDWAQIYPGRVCSPVRADAVPDLLRMVETVVGRYANGKLLVDYWQFGNEVDFTPEQIIDGLGSGCWGTTQAPYYGGDYYGDVLKRVYPAIRSANGNAIVYAAGLAHLWPDDSQTLGFLRGMLAVGAGASFDALSFSGYGIWGASDRLLLKAAHLRQVLGEYGLGAKPLVVAEMGMACPSPTSCPEDFNQLQANYAARIYAEAIAMDLQGAFWFSLASTGPEPLLNAQLIDQAGSQLTPRPAYYALRNTAAMLREARYAGPPITNPPIQGEQEIQSLVFTTSRSTLFLFWIQDFDGKRTYWLPVAPGTKMICTEQLELPVPVRYDCTNQGERGVFEVQVSESPRYVEVLWE